MVVMASRLAQLVLEDLERLAGARPRVMVAFSGGLDSTVLAHALIKQRRKLGGLRLVHIDHGLQPASRDWSRHCGAQARVWKVEFTSLAAKLTLRRGESPEAAARDARYALLARELRAGEVLVTAQHQDDQAETLLLQLFRGAGVAGLAAMPPHAPFASGCIVRPLLARTRAELALYAKQHRLQWVEDPSNQNEKFARNFLRHRVMPLLREKWQGVDAAIARSARHMAEASKLLNETAQRDLVAVADGDGLNVAAMRRLNLPRRRNLLRAFIAGAGFEMPSSVQIMEIAVGMLSARVDAQPEVSWGSCTVSRRAGRLHLQVKSQLPAKGESESALKSWHWKAHRVFVLNDSADRLTLLDDRTGDIDLDKLPAVIELRPRRGGEKLRPGVRARTQTLKNLLQSAKLNVEQRKRLPLLFAGEGPKGRLIAAGDRWLDASVIATVKSRHRARLVWSQSE